MKTSIIIPARYSSSRFPGKPLVLLHGKPMIIWTAEACALALGKENVFIATDDTRIVKTAEEFGFKSILTSKDLLTGTDRVYEASKVLDADIYINVQGDEPMVI